MTFDPITKSLKISADEASAAGKTLLAAIHYFRKEVGLGLDGYTNGNGRQTCECCILEAAEQLGIDLGSTRAGKLDVREFR